MHKNSTRILEGICYIALTVDNKVEFECRIEGSGQLLVGKHRINIMDVSEGNSCCIKSSLFYSSLVIPALNTCKKSGKDSIEVVRSDNIKLAIIPLCQLKLIDTSACTCIHRPLIKK